MNKQCYGLINYNNKIITGDFNKVFIATSTCMSLTELVDLKKQCEFKNGVYFIDDLAFCEGKSLSEVRKMLTEL